MSDTKTAADYGATILRIALGLMFLSHSIVLKYFVMTLDGNAQFFASLGLPPILGYLVFAGEALGGLALILGVWPRAVAVALLPILQGALWVHAGNGWMFASPNGGWEYPAFLVVSSVVVALVGDGAWAVAPTPVLGGRGLRTA